MTLDDVLNIHEMQISEHGGSSGLRSEDLLNAALARPRHKFEYEEGDICLLAAAYCFGIVKNHPFSDSNKRTGFMTMFAFLYINRQRLTADEVDAAEIIEGVAGGSIAEAELADWLRANTQQIA